MPIYKQTTEITNIDDLLSSVERDIEEAYFGDKQVFTVWATYDGTLPAQYSANGSILADYRIYGAAGGVGDDSGTAYGYEVDMSVSDGTISTTTPIYIGDTPLGEDEYVDYGEQKVYRRTVNLFEVENNMLSSLNWALNPPFGTGSRVYFINYKLSDTVTQELKQGIHTCSIFENFTDGYTPNLLVCAFTPTITNVVDDKYRILTNQGVISIKTFDFSKWQDIYLIIGYGGGFNTESEKQLKIDELFENWEISIVEGPTAPSTYIPYLQPTDPPVPLPSLPTVDGTNIVDYVGQSAAVPSRFVAKYRKEGFN